MVTKNSIDSNIPIEVAKGGTNAITMATSTGIVKYDGTNLVTSSTMKIDASNILVNSAQPAFMAYLPSVVNDVTGNGAVYDFGSTVNLTEVFDNGNNFNVNGTFTAPVTGRYYLIGNIRMTSASSSMKGLGAFITSNSSYLFCNTGSPNGTNSISFSAIVDMDAADTAIMRVIYSSGSKVVDAYGAANDRATSFCGFLVC